MQASIIIPTYQRTAFLSEALVSVVAQDFPKDAYEILLVDNAPHPSAALMALSQRFVSASVSVVYVHEPNNGLHHARHAGARVARGDVLVYIDDDVLCPAGWLAAMLAPYRDSQVAMVAGKVVLCYETTPPEWLFQFRGILSALDRGDASFAMSPYGSPVGCNMSVRKAVLFQVGGFNPDGFGDRRLLYLRGDGECGLARKVHDARFTVWYAPDAWLKHRVPARRMTPEYIAWRNAIGGIESAYGDLRYRRHAVPGLLIRCIRSYAYMLYHRLCLYVPGSTHQRYLRHLAAGTHHQYRALQYWRQTTSSLLRMHTQRASYL